MFGFESTRRPRPRAAKIRPTLLVMLLIPMAISCAKRQTESRVVPSSSGGSTGHSSTTNASSHQADRRSDQDVRRVTVDELRESLRRGEAVIIDVRNEAQYRAGHISGARWIPAGELAERAHRELPKDRLIVTYCS